MRVFRREIRARDLVPPLAQKAWSYAHRRLGRPSPGNRWPPFDQLPGTLEAGLILDVGANRGDTAEAALRSYPDATVVCFEPVNETRAALTQRLRRYGDRVRIYDCALADVEGTGEIRLVSFHGANSILPQSRLHAEIHPHIREIGVQPIRVVTLDGFAHQLPDESVDVLKVDVEGFERQVLQGGARFLPERVRFLIIELAMHRDNYWHEQSYIDLLLLLRRFGFSLYNIFDIHRHSLGIAQMDCVFLNTQFMYSHPPTGDDRPGLLVDARRI